MKTYRKVLTQNLPKRIAFVNTTSAIRYATEMLGTNRSDCVLSAVASDAPGGMRSDAWRRKSRGSADQPVETREVSRCA